MIHPSPTTAIAPNLARGVLERIIPCPEGAAGPEGCDLIVLSVPNSNYQLHLRPAPGCSAQSMADHVGKRIVGTIDLTARRIDTVDTGGKYIEPVIGRPRRVQGRVVDNTVGTRTLLLDAGPVPVHARLTDDRQTTADFTIGDLVSFDAMDGATFTAH